MNEEEKEAIYKTAIEVGEIIGRYGTDKQIELFKKMLEDYKIKSSGYFKLQKENDTLKTTINKQSKDISEQLKELDKKDKVIDLLYADIEYEYIGTSFLKPLEDYYKEVEDE